jgi:hypothetical protein
MKTWILISSFLFSFSSFAAETGKPAPDFTAITSEGKTVKLSDFKGKPVVMEWLNHGCPFVKKHYDGKNMQALQKTAVDKGAVWISVISSAPGKQGHSDAKQAEADRKKVGSNASFIVLDEKGAIGKLYGAETTPHMYVVNAKGELVYQGAIDDKASTEIADIKTAKNYVLPALDSAITGKPAPMAQTKAYGCSVKYN